jgi:hypothetical protein
MIFTESRERCFKKEREDVGSAMIPATATEICRYISIIYIYTYILITLYTYIIIYIYTYYIIYIIYSVSLGHHQPKIRVPASSLLPLKYRGTGDP